MKSRKFLIIITILLLFLIGVILLFRNAGTYLVKSEPLKKANAMILLIGSIPDRVLQAADVYLDRFAGKLIIVEESMGSNRKLEERGAQIISNTTQARDAAVAMGIPGDSIIILPGDARSTQMEAVIVREYLKTQPGLDTIILVTSPDHARRATMIFEKAFQKQNMPVVVYSSPSKYSSYTGKGWWKNKEGIQTVMFEYLKMINFWMFDKGRL